MRIDSLLIAAVTAAFLVLGACQTAPPDDDDTSDDDSVDDDDSTDDDDDSTDDDDADDDDDATDETGFYVATDGDDGASGTFAEPFATLERARTAVRELIAAGLPEGGVTVWVRGGVYERTQTFELTEQDRGTVDAPVVYSGYPDETARLIGGRVLDPSAFTTTDSSSPIWHRLDPTAQGQVLQVDLEAAGISDHGVLNERGFYNDWTPAALEVFFDGEPLPLARWPDADDHEPLVTSTDSQFTLYGEADPDVTGLYAAVGTIDGVNSYERQGLVDGLQYGVHRRTWDYLGNHYVAWFLTTTAEGYPSDTDPWWARYDDELGAFRPGPDASGSPTTRIPGQINWGYTRVDEAVSGTEFTYFGDRPDRWTEAEEIWLHGYWVYHWADQTVRPTAIDTASSTITLTGVPGYGIKAGQPWFAFNLLEEITQPGEWYLDRSSGLLYIWPPSDPAGAETVASVMEAPLIRLDDTEQVTIRDLTLEATRTRLIEVIGGSDNTLSGLALRNAGTTAVTLGGTRNTLERSEIVNAGSGGVTLTGGDRPSLVPGSNAVRNCEIHRFSRFSRTNVPAVRINGVGQIVEHNWIHDAPHSAIMFDGNEHDIAYNDIHDVCEWTSDAGAIYGGRDWGARGNRIRFNFIHDIASDFDEELLYGYGVHGVYMDACISGISVFGNVLYEISGHAILHAGGRDDFMENNLAVGCGSGVWSDSQGINRIVRNGDGSPGSFDLLQKIEDMNYQEDPWASAYPALAAIPDDWDVLSDPDNTWLYPEGSVYSRNLAFRTANPTYESTSGGSGTFDKFAEIADNLEDVDPLFVDEEAGDLSLSPESPALAIPGFVDIPFDAMGIQP